MAAAATALGSPFLLHSAPSLTFPSPNSSAASAQTLRLPFCSGLALSRRIAGPPGDSDRDLSASAVSLEALEAAIATDSELPSATDFRPYDYTRSGNPTRDVLQSLMPKLEKADQAFCFTSGMAALAAVTHLLQPGQEIVVGEDIYGGSDRLLSQVVPRKGIVASKRVDTTEISDVASAIGHLTKLVWLGSPTNPRQQISDIKTTASPLDVISSKFTTIYCPILSADLVMHSATKFIAGYSDLMGGILAVKGESLAKEIAFLQNAELKDQVWHLLIAGYA
ncbi:hypothetical protein ACP70R_048620 [Stipagrostis hirtigluma subsp. patula]